MTEHIKGDTVCKKYTVMTIERAYDLIKKTNLPETSPSVIHARRIAELIYEIHPTMDDQGFGKLLIITEYNKKTGINLDFYNEMMVTGFQCYDDGTIIRDYHHRSRKNTICQKKLQTIVEKEIRKDIVRKQLPRK